jgi:hypothetical protein
MNETPMFTAQQSRNQNIGRHKRPRFCLEDNDSGLTGRNSSSTSRDLSRRRFGNSHRSKNKRHESSI